MTPPLAPAADMRTSSGADASAANPASDATLRSESMNALAALLLDWRVDCERQLRGLTSMQRWLERVRCGAAAEGERELLLQEVGRLLGEAPPNNTDWTRQAETYLNIVRDDR